MAGDGYGEAYTAIVWGVGVSLEMAILRRLRPSTVYEEALTLAD